MSQSTFKPLVVVASRDDQEHATATLVTAFVADPFSRWIFPDGLKYLTYFPLSLQFFAGRAFEYGSAYRSDDFAAAAYWLPPGVGPDEEAFGALLEKGVEGPLLEEVFAVMEKMGASHPDVPHWYLPAIGVDPRCQGMGYGSALLARGLEVCDRDHVAAYLETTNPANVRLYERFGFKVVGEIQAGSSPTIKPMLRAAR